MVNEAALLKIDTVQFVNGDFRFDTDHGTMDTIRSIPLLSLLPPPLNKSDWPDLEKITNAAKALRATMLGHIVYRNHLSVDYLNRPLITLPAFHEVTITVSLGPEERQLYYNVLASGSRKKRSKKAKDDDDDETAQEVRTYGMPYCYF